MIGYCSHQNVHEKVKNEQKWRDTMEVFPNVFSLARRPKGNLSRNLTNFCSPGLSWMSQYVVVVGLGILCG